jgi:CRP-like cAMP-binding protein
MIAVMAAPAYESALLTRLSRLTRLAADQVDALRTAERDQFHVPARRKIIGEGDPIRERRALLSGWACRERILSDGRRQILSFLLPGDLIGMCRHTNPVAPTSIVAITDLVTCPVPAAEPGSGLAEAYARSAALEEYYLLAHVMRLGRLNALERLADWLLEHEERLALAGLSSTDQFAVPLTQEMLADSLGLTSVHVNRTLQAMRRGGLLTMQGGQISLSNRKRLVDLVDFQPARIASDCKMPVRRTAG